MKGNLKKILKSIAIVALAFAITFNGGRIKKPDIHVNGDNHIQYTQK